MRAKLHRRSYVLSNVMKWGVLGGAVSVLCACATSDAVLSPARATTGRTGFGISQARDTMLTATTFITRTGVAGVSSKEPEPGGGDYVWRITGDASATLELCHAAWVDRPCRTALFDGGPNPLGPMAKIAAFPILVDPINLGRIELVVSNQDFTWVLGRPLDVTTETMPSAPGHAVWAFGGGGGLHHCAIEDGEPRCHALKQEGAAVAGAPLSIKTYDVAGVTHEAVWLSGPTMTHCEIAEGKTSCVVAQGTPPMPLFGRRVLASHVIQNNGASEHVVWFQTSSDLWRCHTHESAATCAQAKKE